MLFSVYSSWAWVTKHISYLAAADLYAGVPRHPGRQEGTAHTAAPGRTSKYLRRTNASEVTHSAQPASQDSVPASMLVPCWSHTNPRSQSLSEILHTVDARSLQLCA